MVAASLAQAGVRRKPGEPVPGAIVLLSDGAQNRGILQPLAGGQAREGGRDPVYTVVARHARRARSRSASARFVNSIPVPPDPTTMRADRARDRRQVVHGAERVEASSRSTRRSARASAAPTSAQITSWFAVAAAGLLAAAVGAAALFESRVP